MEEMFIRRILVVDDDDQYRSMVRQYLDIMGYAPETARNAYEALGKIAEGSFDLVISDIRMKGKDGLQLIEEARRTKPRLPFIIMTGYAADYSYLDIVRAGADDFLAKPFEVGELQAKMERLGREKSMIASLRTTNDALSWESRVNASLAELTEALLSSVPIEDISCMVLNCAEDLTQSSYGFVGFIDPATGALVATTTDASKNCLIAEEDDAFREFSRLWGWVLDHRETLLINDLSDSTSSKDASAGRIPIQRFLAAPAFTGEDLIGIVAIANSPREYGGRESELMKRLAGVYALAVSRKRHDEALQKAQAELKVLVEERTAKLSKAGDLLRRSMKNMEMLKGDAK